MSGTFRKMRERSYLAYAAALGTTLLIASHAVFASERGLGPASATAVEGQWGYRSDCGSGHYVRFSAKPAGADVEGTWSDGTRAGGESGSFKGRLREGKLFVRFCSDEETRGGFPLCPAYGTGDDAYFVPVGKDLAWYRTWGSPADGKFEKYVELHRTVHGEKVPLDTRCPAGSN
ncbi:hypothetical protein J2T07_002506 [Luteibacter jiangsuensis]|uniref:Secreted protein n=1 Tax=Luteibacter jiangsuensis TaxID=637577 RepID=A0ABT9SZ84_9GAMM|nr:hypothetical protein [Luteibacter jiangsuensis]MDQ0010316.1 hypothetical protein [Luteibacter jiangsuensis]